MFNFLSKKIEFVLKNPQLVGSNPNYPTEINDFIVQKNLIVLYCSFICFIATIYYFIIAEAIDASMYFSGGVIMIIGFFNNKIKYLYFFKFLSIFFINLAILFACLSFKRSEFYVFCFLITIYVSNILFSYKSLIYLVILTSESILFIFIVHFYNGSVQNSQDLEKNLLSNFIFLMLIFYGITEISEKINYFKDTEYLKDKAKLYKINKSLIRINTDINQLNVAALHSMKTPLYVAEDFIKQLHNNTYNEEYITLINNSIQLSEMYVQNLFIYDALITNMITIEEFNILEKIKFVTEIAIKKSSAVSITIDCKSANVKTNEFCFLVILENLITNGLKYNLNDQKVIGITVNIGKYETIILVKDNGIGIDPIYFDRIFFPFVRINQEIQIDGTGLGLSSVRIAASKINGNVKVLESSKNGTTFEFKFKNN